MTGWSGDGRGSSLRRRGAGRWGLVGLGVVLLVLTPAVVRSWPVADADVAAAEVLARVEASSAQPYSGYVETQGTLALPVADRFTDIGRLFGGADASCGSGGATRTRGESTG